MKKLQSLLIFLLLAFGTALHAQSTASGIKVPFTLRKAGYVTLVIEDSAGRRVRNLCADSYFEAGNHTIFWDGKDDLGRDAAAVARGIYSVPGKSVAPGTYRLRGIVHQEIIASYALSVYAPGSPPWPTNDHLGGWMANHTAPQAVAFVPAARSPSHTPLLFLGAYVSEGTDGLIWVDMDGKKLGGRTWIGGNWTGAPFIAADTGSAATAGISIYTAATWKTDDKSAQVVLRVNALPKNDAKAILEFPVTNIPNASAEQLMAELSGFAVHNGLGAASLPGRKEVVLMDLKQGSVLAEVPMEDPKGLVFDAHGALLVLSGNRLLRFQDAKDAAHLKAAQVLISSALDAPLGITVDRSGDIYIANGGKSQQVLVFSATGKLLRSIGHAGAPAAGKYDPLHMNNPTGLAIDDRQLLWVAENDYMPKRVSVWTLEGKLIRAFYGPAKYGGGGTLDPLDTTRYYYSHNDLGTLEFKLNWNTGESVLDHVLYRKMPGAMVLAERNSAPETPVYVNGKRYFTNCYTSNPTGGSNVAYVFVEKNGQLQPAAAMGRADSWEVLKEDRFKALWPAGVDLNSSRADAYAFFIWNDLNEDAAVQPAEVVMQKGEASGVTVMGDLSFCIAQLRGNAVQFVPVRFTAGGIPIYDAAAGKLLAKGVLPPASSGGNQVLTAKGSTVVTQGIQPYDRLSLSGVAESGGSWSYPDLWPGLHASHSAPLPGFPGELIGTTRLLGGVIRVGKEELFAVNSNHGMVYIFTTDGLLLTTLFEPMRSGKPWNMQQLSRGAELKGLSLGEENFWPGITATANGTVYLSDGNRSSLVRLSGLQQVERLPAVRIVLKEGERQGEPAAGAQSGQQVQQGAAGLLQIGRWEKALPASGDAGNWKHASWVDIGQSAAQDVAPAGSKPYVIKGAMAVAGDRLHVFYRTGDTDLLQNAGEMPAAPFKTGGALDLMISSEPSAQAHAAPREGDMRLLVTLIKGKPYALLYRAVVAGTKAANRVPFSSPSRTISFDRVDEVTDQVELARGAGGDYEIAVPLRLLNIKATAGMEIRGDLGVLRGDGAHTLSRMYWNNKATAIVSDVPSEAELTPALWGLLQFER